MVGSTGNRDEYNLIGEGVLRTTPRFVLSEDLDIHSIDEDVGSIATFRKIRQKYETEFSEDTSFTSKSLERIYEEDVKGKSFSEDLTSFNDFLDTPIFNMEGLAVKQVTDSMDVKLKEIEDEYLKWYDPDKSSRVRDEKYDSINDMVDQVRSLNHEDMGLRGVLADQVYNLRSSGLETGLYGFFNTEKDNKSDSRIFAPPQNVLGRAEERETGKMYASNIMDFLEKEEKLGEDRPVYAVVNQTYVDIVESELEKMDYSVFNAKI